MTFVGFFNAVVLRFLRKITAQIKMAYIETRMIYRFNFFVRQLTQNWWAVFDFFEVLEIVLATVVDADYCCLAELVVVKWNVTESFDDHAHAHVHARAHAHAPAHVPALFRVRVRARARARVRVHVNVIEISIGFDFDFCCESLNDSIAY